MSITIIGSGNMARGIGTRLVAAGQRPTLYGQDAEQASALAADLGAASTTDLGDALAADVVVLATPSTRACRSHETSGPAWPARCWSTSPTRSTRRTTAW